MKDITELKRQYEALGKEIEKLDGFVAGWYMFWDDNRLYHIEKVDRVDDLECVNWDHYAPVTQELLNQFLPKSTLYDWSDAPDWAQWAATDKNGRAFWYKYRPDVSVQEEPWIYTSMYKIIEENHHAVLRCVDWKDSLEQRPC